MAELWQGVQGSLSSSLRLPGRSAERPKRRASGKGRFWIVLDVITVVGAAALVIQVIGVLPDIEPDDGFSGDAGDFLAHDGAVLVRRGADRELLAGGDIQPRPAGPEAGRRGLPELLLELVE